MGGPGGWRCYEVDCADGELVKDRPDQMGPGLYEHYMQEQYKPEYDLNCALVRYRLKAKVMSYRRAKFIARFASQNHASLSGASHLNCQIFRL